MSWSTDVTIWCDVEDCPEWIMGDAIQPATVAAARRHAKRSGWSHRRGQDLCPQHSRR